MNWIKNLIQKKKIDLPNVNNGCYPLQEHEQLLIETVVELLKSKPNAFSAKWFTGKRIDQSIRSQDGNILIMIQTGEIIDPIRPTMSKEQKEIITKLIIPIVEKDSKYVIEKIIQDCATL